MTAMTESPVLSRNDLREKFSLIDTHAHLQMEPLAQDPSGVISRARSVGVNWIVSVGIDLEDARNMLNIIVNFDQIYACIGYHPHNASLVSDNTLDEMRNLAKHPKIVGYGEIGLDFFRNLSPRDTQLTAFQDQLLLAKDLELPVVIHLRDAYEEGLAILEEFGPFPKGGVIHCFSGSKEEAFRTLELGFYISIPGTITYKKNGMFREIVGELPLHRILLETDCPFLSPEPLRGKHNEPSHLIYTAIKVAELHGADLKTIAEITTRNAFNLFGLSE